MRFWMANEMGMTINQKFELEKISRVIDATADPQQLQQIAKQLLQAWQSQRAATDWAIRQQMQGF